MATGCSTTNSQARVIVQQCISARLRLNAKDLLESEDPIYANINRGIVVFICFKKGATLDCVNKIASKNLEQSLPCKPRSVLDAKLSYSVAKKGMCSVQECGNSVLVVPQASMGGRLKGKSVQYHDLCAKDEGQVLYHKFVEDCQELSKGTGTQVFSGTYGNRQVLSMDTEGPFTHVFDF